MRAADVIVERKSQKGIVIGKGGTLLKEAGTAARHDLEALLGNRVNLRLQVKVEPDWQRKPQLLDRLGRRDHCTPLPERRSGCDDRQRFTTRLSAANEATEFIE